MQGARVGVLGLTLSAALWGCDPDEGSERCAEPPEVDDSLEGVSWKCIGPGGGAVPVPGPEGAELIFPAGALAGRTKIVIRRPKEADMGRLDLWMEPADVTLSEPVTLRVAPVYATDTRSLVALHSSVAHAIRSSDAENSAWRHANVVARDAATGSFDIELPELGRLFLSYDPGDRAFVVPDVPPDKLRSGDVLGWLTEIEDEPGPSWLPGHVALLACEGEGGAVVLDVTPDRGVCMRSLDELTADATLTALGARRPRNRALRDDERRAIVEAAFATSLEPSSYAMAGSGSGGSPSSASFVEDALDAADRGTLASVPGFWGAIPHGIFADTVPVSEISVPHDTTLSLPISLWTMQGGLTAQGQFRGAYGLGGELAATGLPDEATFVETAPGRYVLTWAPTWMEVGEVHEVTLRATGQVAEGVPYEVERTLTLTVPGIRHVFDVGPYLDSHRYSFCAPTPDGVVMGDYHLVDAGTGLPVPDWPFPGHSLSLGEPGPCELTPPGYYGFLFWIYNSNPDPVVAEPLEWLFVWEYTLPALEVLPDCEPNPDCRVSDAVNSVSDASDRDPTDGVCNTGARIASGEPECTLRAAIEQANADADADTITFAIPGTGTHTIALTTPLPPITGSLTLDALDEAVDGARGVIVDGAAIAGEDPGLLVERGSLSLRGLGVRRFGGDGVRSETQTDAPLRLDSVDLSENCGWGVFAASRIEISDEAGLGSSVRANGTGPGCAGGGLFTRKGGPVPAVELSGTTIADNAGAGVLSLGPVRLRGENTISANRGEGILVTLGGEQRAGAPITIEDGDTTISDNQGRGIASREGDLVVRPGALLHVRGNTGWGVQIDNGTVTIGAEPMVPPTAPTVVEGNGARGPCRTWDVSADLEPGYSDETCEGGGIFADTHDDRWRVLLRGVELLDNGGPGVLTTGLLDVGWVRAERNEGAGLSAVAGATAQRRRVWAGTGDVVIRDNQGPGIFSTFGSVHIDYAANLDISGNGSWGIMALSGTVTMGDPGHPPASSQIVGNGFGAECFWWDLVDGAVARAPIPCEGGGVYAYLPGSADPHVLDRVEIRDNNGAGVLATPLLRLSLSTIADNLGPGVSVPADPGTDSLLTLGAGTVSISSNQGAGITVESGDVQIDGGASISDNAGTGLHIVDGSLAIATADPDRTQILANGGGPTCHEARIDHIQPPWPAQRTTPCDGGGIWVENGDVQATLVDVEDNLGDGIRASGDVRVQGGRICNNTGEEVISGGSSDLGGAVTTCN